MYMYSCYVLCEVIILLFSLNAVREVCVRCPLSMTSELLQDLTSYKSHHDKSVMMAARSLIQVFRDLNPHMLHRKDRVSYYENTITYMCWVLIVFIGKTCWRWWVSQDQRLRWASSIRICSRLWGNNWRRKLYICMYTCTLYSKRESLLPSQLLCTHQNNKLGQ